MERSAPPRYATSATGTAGLLFALLSVPVLASTGVDTRCTETDKRTNTAEIAAPAFGPTLTIAIADHAVKSTADMDSENIDSPAQSTSSPAPRLSSSSKVLLQQIFDDIEEAEMASPVTESASGDSDASGDETSGTPRGEAPPTATRSPGVSESDVPRFRRQMYRTDI